VLPSNIAFVFELILGSFLAFWGPNGLFLEVRLRLKNCSGSTNLVEQLLFSILTSILTFDLYEIFGSFLYFWALMGYLWARGRIQKLFWELNTLYFLLFLQF